MRFDGILIEQGKPEPVPGQRALTTALMTQCRVYVLRRLGSMAERIPPWLAALKDQRLSQAIREILADPGAPHSLESLSHVASMSRSVLAERFAAAFGRSPMSFVQQVRMQRAARMLQQESNLPIKVIASRVGYASRSHFTEAFQKHVGQAPAAFRAGHVQMPRTRYRHSHHGQDRMINREGDRRG